MNQSGKGYDTRSSGLVRRLCMLGKTPGAVGKIIVGAMTLALAAFYLFYNLGNYSLWADEALTALAAKGILATGDTTAWVGDGNLAAYNNGACLTDLHDRSTPPLPAYMTAASFAVFGVNTWAARLPFALAGLLTAALMLWWARRASPQYFLVLAVGILGNASLFLYFRNCRYYAPTVLFAVTVAWLYWNWRGKKSRLFGLALASSLLFASHYLAYVAVYVCIGVDYLCWRRKETRLSVTEWLVIWLPQVVVNGFVGWIWNPLQTGFSNQMAGNDFLDRMQIFFWNLRDTNACEFLAVPLILTALVVGWRASGNLAIPCRGCVSVLVAAFVISCITPQVRANTTMADVRYVVFLIPLGIALGAWAVCALLPGRTGWSLLLAAVAFFSNVLHGGMYFNWCGVRSTSYCFVRELLHPTNTDPYRETARWMRDNIAPGESVHVASQINDLYPLMFHAPHALYAWQFDNRKNPQFASLPAIHFKGEVMPNYLIGFGQQVKQLQNDIKQHGQAGVEYRPAAKLEVFWRDLYRPELFWRTFVPIENYDRERDAVFIFKRVK